MSRDAPFDAWNAGDDDAISDAAKRGAVLFTGKAQCALCHSGPLLSDFEFHNVSTSLPGPDGVRPDEGRFLVTGREEDRGKFLTPMLRSAAKTSPYLHDGSEVSIRTVIGNFSVAQWSPRSGQRAGPARRGSPIDEVDDLVQFIKSLDGAPIPLADLVALGELLP